MSNYTLDSLKTELACYHGIESAFQSPIDLELLQTFILQKQEESESGSSSGSIESGKQYTDFLLPLPEHLQPTEVGMVDPLSVQKKRQESGLDRSVNKASNQARKELRARAELKQKLVARPRPQPQPTRKIKIAPRPGGFSNRPEGE